MIKRIAAVFSTTLLICLATLTGLAATIGPNLATRLKGAADNLDVGVVIVTFNGSDGLNDGHLAALQSLGISKGIMLQRLGMVAVPATAGQVRALAGNNLVRSIWSNDRLEYHDNQARTLAGVDRVRTDAGMTKLNGGLPVSGRGDFSIVINDSGIDATHDDLKLGDKIIQNVQILTDTDTLAGFTSLAVVENVPDTDLNVGHGTHCAGIAAGTGQVSGGLYSGVAPGAKLVGTGSGAVLFILNALGGFEYSIANQARYGVRIISNSYGSHGPFNPDDPINVASKLAHDLNIIVLFSAGNSGPGRESHNRYGKAPWVISVGAGTKEGGLANFSSRGVPRDERLSDDDPNNDSDAPTIVAPGTGREFDSDSGKFTAAYISTRSKSNVFANGLTDDAELSPAMLPYYTQISGTSMATPFVAGVAALMLDADPTLTPDEVKQILTETATKMPGYEDFQVGAGYVNVYAAVDKVFNRARSYGTLNNPSFNLKLTATMPAFQRFHLEYNPAVSGPTSTNAHTFTVEPNMDVLSAFVTFDTAAGTGDGNPLYVRLTDPQGHTYESEIQLPLIDPANREVVVKVPLPGTWTLEMKGVFGRVAAPGPIDATIRQKRINLPPIADIQGRADQALIETLLKNRMIDVLTDGAFHPEKNVTRADFARALSYNTPLRQSLAPSPRFTDVNGPLGALAEAVTADGSTLRDWNFLPKGMLSASAPKFSPNTAISRLDLAVALIRALGLDAEARAKANTTVTSNGIPVTDNASIPAALRGYVQLALDKGLLEAYPAEVKQIAPGQFVAVPGPRVEADQPVTRAALAAKLATFAERFAAGN